MANKQLEGLEARFMESSEREKIKHILFTKLRSEGWVHQMKALTRQEIRNQGIQDVTVESLFEELVMTGRRNVPNSVKTEIYELVKKWIEEQTNIPL